jgi:NTE family protein
MNAGVLADGLRHAGATGARVSLRQYWEDVGRIPGLSSFGKLPALPGQETWHFDNNPLFLWFDMLTRIWSPYQTNPLNYNPLRGVLERIDFEGLRRDADAARLFICATNVRTGLRRVFVNAELSVDVLLASACLPHMFQAINIDGELYWDGGYTGNPALAPLYVRTAATDVIVIGVNPMVRDSAPNTSREIINRIDEISFNSAFMLELAAIAFIEEVLDSEPGATSRFKRLHIHAIGAGATLGALGASSKMNNDTNFLEHLHKIGRRAADDWLKENLEAVGLQSTVDLSGLIPKGDNFATVPVAAKRKPMPSSAP